MHAPRPVSPNGVRGDERTPPTVAWALEEVAGRIRLERPPLAEAVRWIVGVAADALLDAALALEPVEIEDTGWPDQRRKGRV